MNPFSRQNPTRRAICVGVGAGVPLAALMAMKPLGGPRARDGVVSVGDLVDAAGNATATARAKIGETVKVAGFRAPAFRADALFNLYQGATGPCFSCGLLHDPGAALAVVGSAGAEMPPLNDLAEIAGVLRYDARGALVLAIS